MKNCIVMTCAALGLVLSVTAQERVYSFSTLAGTASAGHADGDGEAARFNRPIDLAVDLAGNIYVADHGNYAVRKITPAGVVSTVAGTPSEPRPIDGAVAVARFRSPSQVEVDPLGNLFVGDSVAVRRIGINGQVSTLAGFAGEGFPATLSGDGSGTQARFNGINGMGISPSGSLFVSDSGNNSIREITPAGVVTTVAGRGSPGQLDGQGTAASFFSPAGVYVDGGGIVWISDYSNHTVRRMTPAGSVTTFAGLAMTSGLADGVASAARLSYPTGITGDPAGNLHISEFGTQGIRRITAHGVVTTVAGKIGTDISSRQGSNDGEGRQASFAHPAGLATDRAGNVYIADAHNNLIRQMAPSGSVTTVAGYSREEAAGHRDARGGEARFNTPWGIAVTTAGTAYVADSGNHVIRRIDPDGTVTTFAGKPGEAGYANGAGPESRFNRPHAIGLDREGNLYVADANNAIRRISSAGVVTALAGSNQSERRIVNAEGAAVSFARTGPLTVGPDGSVYVTDLYNNSIGALRTALRRITPAGAVTTEHEQFWPHSGIGGLAFAPDGTLYLTDAVYAMVFKFKAGLMETVQLSPPGMGFSPHGIAVDRDGNIFLTEGLQNVGSRVAQMSADGTFRIIGGLTHLGWKDGVGTKAVFHEATGIAVDGAGSLYISCATNVIRKGMLAGAPVIKTHPQGATVAAGGSVQLAVEATAEPAPTFQWFRNGTAIGGATAASHTLSAVQASDAGSYTVTVTNNLGAVTSNAAVVSVSTAVTPPPGGTGGTGGAGSAGGGGAPSHWFLGALCLLGWARWIVRGQTAVH